MNVKHEYVMLIKDSFYSNKNKARMIQIILWQMAKRKQNLHTCGFRWLCFVSFPFSAPRLPSAAEPSMQQPMSHSSSTTESA